MEWIAVKDINNNYIACGYIKNPMGMLSAHSIEKYGKPQPDIEAAMVSFLACPVTAALKALDSSSIADPVLKTVVEYLQKNT